MATTLEPREPLEPFKRAETPSVPETRTASSGFAPPQTSAQADGFQQQRPPSVSSTSSTAVSTATVTSQQPVSASRNVRVQSLAIRRKPLPPTAAPLVTRHSTRDCLEITQLSKPETRFSRSYSVDSPTLYDFPDHAKLPIGSLDELALSSNYSPFSSQP